MSFSKRLISIVLVQSSTPPFFTIPGTRKKNLDVGARSQSKKAKQETKEKGISDLEGKKTYWRLGEVVVM
jgi:hypothetical protein